MASLPSDTDVFTALAFIVPGFIVARTREQFITGRKQAVSEDLLEYITYGALNFAVFSWLIYLLANGGWTVWQASLGWFVVILLGPVCLGLLLGIAARKEWMSKFLGSRILAPLGLKPVHVVPTAWDWKFGKMTGEHALVTFKDGTRIGCFLGEHSFISSDPAERDLYAEQVFNIDDNGTWHATRKAVLIAHGEISAIEFWQERNDDELREKGLRAVASETAGRASTNEHGCAKATAAE
jgi:Family of unknown function (DUF6338)